MKVNQGGVMADIGKPMEPDRVPARLYGGAGAVRPRDGFGRRPGAGDAVRRRGDRSTQVRM
ncbi:hypothetical protein STXM2123_2822 [Streptomyces sp. F-3]|uniref:Uncharacterized protein n=1 Tax=Streptomyces thermogriseus TaxID=75292 RepID=A0ABN1SYM3_9ACTN|nr:hypothetical protein STXM2123_2822 [Streptomyces sp. F-3]